MGFIEKSNFRGGGGGGAFTKMQYIGANCLKRGGLGQVADLRGGVSKKDGGGAFERG